MSNKVEMETEECMNTMMKGEVEVLANVVNLERKDAVSDVMKVVIETFT